MNLWISFLALIRISKRKYQFRYNAIRLVPSHIKGKCSMNEIELLPTVHRQRDLQWVKLRSYTHHLWFHYLAIHKIPQEEEIWTSPQVLFHVRCWSCLHTLFIPSNVCLHMIYVYICTIQVISQSRDNFTEKRKGFRCCVIITAYLLPVIVVGSFNVNYIPQVRGISISLALVFLQLIVVSSPNEIVFILKFHWS